ncbi:MAG: xylulokinase [Rhodospirillaceae bacterium]|nr:xylulokinase [Rhodospirillaceae bacterium]
MPHAVGFDIGTSGLKGVLVDQGGRSIAVASRPWHIRLPRPGWYEQDPEIWWTALAGVARDLLSRGPAPDVIGLTGQMHGPVFLDAAGAVLSPAILWNDQRTEHECAEIERLTGGRVADWTLNPPRTAYTSTKILWVRRNLPDVYARIAAVLLPKDFVRFRLSGRLATDVTDASGTGLFDVGARTWSRQTTDALGIPLEWLPHAHESTEVVGHVDREGALATGLKAGTPIVAGAGDQAAAVIGIGDVSPGMLSVNIGTSGVVQSQIDSAVIEPQRIFHTFCHAMPGTWQLIAGVQSAGGTFQWYCDVVGMPETSAARMVGADPFEAVCHAAEDAPPGAEGLVFLPYLTGERSPHNDPRARGCWLGLSRRHERRHLARAVVEGVCFALRDLVDVAIAIGCSGEGIRVAGGGARSALWLRVLADVLGRPLRPVARSDASARGAAVLAMQALTGQDTADVARAWARSGAEIAPEPANVALYESRYRIFRDLYPATQALMHRLVAQT